MTAVTLSAGTTDTATMTAKTCATATMSAQVCDDLTMSPMVCDGPSYFGRATFDTPQDPMTSFQKESFWYWVGAESYTWYGYFRMRIPQRTYDNMLLAAPDFNSSTFLFFANKYDSSGVEITGAGPPAGDRASYNSYTLKAALGINTWDTGEVAIYILGGTPVTPDPATSLITPDVWVDVELKSILTPLGGDQYSQALELRIGGVAVATTSGTFDLSFDTYASLHAKHSMLYLGASLNNVDPDFYGMTSPWIVIEYELAQIATDDWIFSGSGTPVISEDFTDGSIDSTTGQYIQGPNTPLDDWGRGIGPASHLAVASE